MNITKYIPVVHNWYVEQGEYKCAGCGGAGQTEENDSEGIMGGVVYPDCEICNGTGQHKNIGELLAEIAGLLLGNALLAYKKDKKPQTIYCGIDKKERFRFLFKDTFEDYLAMVFIKLFDLLGSFTAAVIPTEIKNPTWIIYANMGEQLMVYMQRIIAIHIAHSNKDHEINLEILKSIDYLYNICKSKNINIETYIEFRLQYMGLEV